MSSLVVIAVVGFLCLWVVGIYNRLVRGRNAVKNSFSQIDVQLKRRYDLIPNLVDTAKGFMSHEKDTLEAVISARNQAVRVESSAASDPNSSAKIKDLMVAESQLGGALGRLMAVAEAYPTLKSDQTMIQLMEELRSTENKVSFARQAYNDSVMFFNNQREMFPNSLFAGFFGFAQAESFEITNEIEKENVRVKF